MLLANRPQHEQALAKAIAKLSESQRRMVVAAWNAEGTFDARVWQALAVEVKQQLQAHLGAIHGTSSQRLLEKLGERVPREMHESAGLTWAARVLDGTPEEPGLAAKIADTLRQRIEAHVAELEAPTAFDVDNALLKIFTPERDSVLAATEYTRAQSAGEFGAADRWNSLHPDQVIEPRWKTERDAKTCWICDPLDNQREVTWGVEFPSGPPAHPNCRCWLDWSEPAAATGREGDVVLTRAAA